jgi:hypothetical protein
MYIFIFKIYIEYIDFPLYNIGLVSCDVTVLCVCMYVYVPLELERRKFIFQNIGSAAFAQVKSES